MKKLLFILQNVFKIFIIFLLVFVWARYFIRSLWWSILASTLITLAIDFSTRLVFRKKNNKANLKLKEKEAAENIFLSLVTNNQYMEFFHKLVKSKYPSTEKKEKYILINHSEKVKSVLFPLLKFSPLNVDDLTEIISTIKDENVKKVVIATGEIDKNALVFAKNFDYEIVILDKFETYKHLYKLYEIYPEISMQYKKSQKLNFKDLVAFSFNKSRAKGYLFSAFVLLLSSVFVRSNLYYLIMASLLLIFALISYANPYYNTLHQEEIL